MKILMVTPYYFPVIGGTEGVVENLSVKLNEMGVPTDVMSFNFTFIRGKALMPFWKERNERISGVNVIKIPAFNLLPWQLHSDKMNFMINLIPGRFAHHFKSYDIIHFHNDLDLSFPFFSYPIDKPKIFHCHCLDTSYHLYKKNFISRYLFKNTADIYIAISKSVLELLVKLGICREKIRVVHNGIDVKRFQPCRETHIGNLLLFVGRLQPKKGLHVLLKSLNYLETPVQLVIIGPVADPKYFEKILILIKKINENNFHRVVHLGVQKLGEVIKWYQKASILVCPSLSEPFGIVNLEALSCETPVVASNVEGIPEAVHDNINGVLVAPNDPVRLAEGIQSLLDNEETRRKFGKEGRKLVRKEFSSEVMAENFIQIYKEMIDQDLFESRFSRLRCHT